MVALRDVSPPLWPQALQQDTWTRALWLAEELLPLVSGTPAVHYAVVELLAPGSLLERSYEAIPLELPVQAAIGFVLNPVILEIADAVQNAEELQDASKCLSPKCLLESLLELAMMGAAMAATSVLLPCKARHLHRIATKSPSDIDESAASAAVESMQIGLDGEVARADAAWAPDPGISLHSVHINAADAVDAARPILVTTMALNALRRLTDSDHWRAFDHAAELEVMLPRSTPHR